MRDLRSIVAACNADSMVVPCDETGSAFACPGAPDGMLRHFTPKELQGIFEGFQQLCIRWKIEVERTPALVIGTNKIIFGHPESDGSWVIERSCDTNLGGHLADASDTPGRLLPHGHWAWPADLLAPVLATAAESTDLARPLSLPDALFLHGRTSDLC